MRRLLRPLRPSWHWLALIAVVALYAAASWVALLPFGLLESNRLPVSGAQDVGQQVWWLALALHDVTHGDWSFFTAAIDHPTGVNLLDNGSMPLLGLLMAPVTSAFGPVASYLLLLRIGHFLSACAAAWVTRRLGFGWLAAAAAGLIYGFGPATSPPTAQHAFLIFAPLPPLMLYLIYRGLRPREQPGDEQKPRAMTRSLRAGLVLGVLAAMQFLISSETLVFTLLLAGCVVVLVGFWGLVRHRALPFRPGALWRLLLGALATGVPLLEYPVGYMLLGRAHVVGPIQPTGQPAIKPISILLPARLDASTPGGQTLAEQWHRWTVGQGLWPSFNLGYLGLLALVALVVALAIGWRDSRLGIATLFGALAVLLALGVPFSLFYRVSLLQDAEPTRATLLVDLAVAVLVAGAVDRCLSAARRCLHFRLRALAGLLLAVAGLAAVGAGMALAAPDTDLAAYPVSPSRGASQAIGRLIPRGAIVLAGPYPSFNHENAMLLQAQSGFHFDLLGGYAIRAHGPLRHATKVPPVGGPPAIRLLLEGHGGEAKVAAAEFPRWLRARHVSVILALPTDPAGRTLANVAGDAFGPPRFIRGWLLWRV